MFKQVKKTIAVLLVVCFLLSVTAAAASACEEHGYKHKQHKHYKDSYNEGKDVTNCEDTTGDSADDDAPGTTSLTVIQQVAIISLNN